MSAIGVIETTLSTEVASTSTSFTEVVASSTLEKSTEYYVICHALCEGSSNNAVFEWQLEDQTNTLGVPLPNSVLKREPNSADKTQSYTFVGKFTTSLSVGNLSFQQNLNSVK